MKSVLVFLCILNASAFAASPKLSPYDVVAPTLSGDPASGDRVAGQMYFDSSTSLFKGISNTGSVQVLTQSGSSGAKIGPVSVTGSPSGFVQIPFTTSDVEYDTGSYVSTNTFTVPAAGIYLITMLGYYPNSGGAETIIWAYQINSNPKVGILQAYIPSGANQVLNGSAHVKLNAGDTVVFYVTDANFLTFANIELAVAKL